MKVSDVKVAKETGVAYQTINAWKNGKYTPKVDKLMAIATYLQIPVEEII
jgi:DNA-binding XRE family transcriptional regulator